MTQAKKLFYDTKIKIESLLSKVFSSRKKTVLFSSLLVLSLLILIQLYIVIINNSVYNNRSDDILQYYVLMEGFIRSLKEGTVSSFDLNNYFGASFFSNLYYVPLDVFTLLSFLLSFIMPTVVAVSTTELIKVAAGVGLVGTYLALKKYSTKTIFLVSMLYFVNGGTVSFMNFPAFLSMTVYLPLALLVVHWFFEKKYWTVPLFVFAIVLYNFYLAYMVLAFIAFSFLLEYFLYKEFSFIDILKKGMLFLSLLLFGVLMSSVILLPAITFIAEETIRTPVEFTPWVLDLKLFQLELFPPDVYIRYFAKLFVPQRPASFRGFLNDYKLEHVSSYITLIGVFAMTFVFFLKDKKARVFKTMFVVVFVFSLFPFFSSLLSGTYLMELLSSEGSEAFPYNRWLNMVPLLYMVCIAHVLETFNFKQIKSKAIWISYVGLFTLGIAVTIYYRLRLTNGSFTDSVTQSIHYDSIFMIVTLGIFIIFGLMFFLKKPQYIKFLLFLELFLAIGFMMSSGVSSHNKISTFQEMNQINAFMKEHIDGDDFKRVYVDIAHFDVQDRNFNQMTSLPVNTRVFHSWPDAETDELAFLLFPTTHPNSERQAKVKMNYYGYYINQFLGYEYVLTKNNDNALERMDHYEKVAEDAKFALYKIKQTTPFYVFDQYMTYSDFKNLNVNQFPRQEKERLFLRGALIDDVRYRIEDLDLEELTDLDIQYLSKTGRIFPYRNQYTQTMIEKSSFTNPSVEKEFYVYEDFGIDFSHATLYLKDAYHESVAYNEVFYEDNLGNSARCSVNTYAEKTFISCANSLNPIQKVYVEKTESLITAPSLQYRLERRVDFRNYLVYSIENIAQETTPLAQNTFFFTSYKMGRNFVETSAQELVYSVDAIFPAATDYKRLYVEKTNEIANYSDLFLLGINYTSMNVDMDEVTSAQQNIENPYLEITNGKLTLSFDYKVPTTKDNIVVIPVTYSEDWKLESEIEYDTMSVSGGFLGIVIPRDTVSVAISMKYIPKNIHLGGWVTLGAVVVYLGAIVTPEILKRKKDKEKTDES